MVRRVHAALVAAAAVTVTALAGCTPGGGSTGTVALATREGLTNAAQRTAAARTARVEMAVNAAGGPGGGVVTITATGAIDAEHDRFSLSMDLTALLAGLPASADAIGSSVELVGTGDTVFFRSPFFAQALGVTTDWVGMQAGAGSTLDPTDPVAFLDLLHGTGADVERVGHETVRGVETDTIHATVTVRAALANAPAGARNRLQRALEQLGDAATGLLDAELPVDVDVDSDGIIRKLVLQIRAPASAADTQAAAVSIEYFDFGEPVTIEPPPADQVTDVTARFDDLAGALGEG